MLVETKVRFDTLERLLVELAPLRIHMAPKEENSRWLELEEPTEFQPIPGRGLRIATHGRARFEIGGIPLQFRIKRIQIVLEPVIRVRGGRPELAFGIDIEDGDLGGIPSLLETMVLKRVNKALTPKASKMVWKFGESLTRSFALPDRMEPEQRFGMKVDRGEIEVTAEDFTYRMYVDPRILRDGPLPEIGDEDGDDDLKSPATQEALTKMVALNREV